MSDKPRLAVSRGVYRRKRADGSVYYDVTFFDGNKVRRCEKVNDLRGAVRLRKQRLEEVRLGTYAPTGRTRDSVSAAFDRHCDELEQGGVRTVNEIRGRFARHVEPIIGDMAVNAPTVDDIRRVLASVAAKTHARTGKPLSTTTARHVYNDLGSFFRWAARAPQRLTTTNPCEDLPPRERPLKARTPRGAFRYEDASALIFDERIPVDQRVFNALSLFTGMRSNELCGLRWRHLTQPEDSDLQRITLMGQGADLRPTKTRREVMIEGQPIPVAPQLAEILDAWGREGFPMLFGRAPTADDPIVPSQEKGDDGYTFRCRHIRNNDRRLKRACKTLGIAPRLRTGAEATPAQHVLRHTFVTLAQNRFGQPKEAVRRFTHATDREAIDGYCATDWGVMCGVARAMYFEPPPIGVACGSERGDSRLEAGTAVMLASSGSALGIHLVRHQSTSSVLSGTLPDSHRSESAHEGIEKSREPRASMQNVVQLTTHAARRAARLEAAARHLRNLGEDEHADAVQAEADTLRAEVGHGDPLAALAAGGAS